MSAIISIPSPCHEDWNTMTPKDQGRHCDVCCKTVVDFTAWQPHDILFYLQQNAAKKVCGRFLPDQLDEPIPTPEDFVRQLHHFSVPFLKKAAAIFLFAFNAMMMSCNDNEKLSGVTVYDVDTLKQEHIDSPKTAPKTIGEPAIMPKPETTPVRVCYPAIKGDISVTTGMPEIQMPEVVTGKVDSVIPTPPIIDTFPGHTIIGAVASPADLPEINSNHN